MSSRRAVARRLLAFGRPLLGVVALSTLFRILGMSCGVALVAVSANAVARTAGGDSVSVGSTALLLITLSLAKGVLRYLEQYCGHWVAFRLLAMLRNDFYRRIVPLAPARLVAAEHSGDLMTRVMRDIDRVEVFYAHSLAPAIAAVVMPIAVLVAVSVLGHPLLAGVLAPFVVAVGLAVPILGHAASAGASAAVLTARGRVSAQLTDGIQGIAEILAFGAGERRAAEFARLGESVTDARSRLGRLISVRRGVTEALIAFAMASIVISGFALVNRGSIDLPSFAVTLALAFGSFGPVVAVEEFMPDLDQAFAAARRMWTLLDAEPAVRDPAAPVPPPKGGNVSFDRVSFAYPESADPAVSDVSFEIPRGRTVAVVGASGAGKSTLVSLLVRFWDPETGVIRIDGIDVRHMRMEELRRRVAVIGQRTHLFNESIAANLRIAKPAATMQEIESACRRAAVHDFIASLPQGYDTVVGELGTRLSGGQRQRIAIARALLADAPILVLDEATSELDAQTEREILATLEGAAAQRTTLIVAHRLATVANADEIIVLDRGRGVERGTHEGLLAAGGPYATLWKRQELDYAEATRAGSSASISEAGAGRANK